MNAWFADNPWVTLIIIYALLVFVYNKVFRTRKLPILKNLVVYALIALGAFMLLFFQIHGKLPIVYSLLVAVALMAVAKVRSITGGKQGGDGNNPQ